MSPRFVLADFVLMYGASTGNAFGQEPPKPNPLELNAALVYWQAFALMPELSEAEWKICDDVDGDRPVDEEAKKIVLKSGEALQSMHRASKLDQVAWGIAWESGPHALLPHISKARELNRVAILRAHVRFEEGKPKEAVADLLAAMRMGRQVARDGVITVIPLLVDYSIEAMCISALAKHLPQLDAEMRAELKKGLALLPRSRTLTDAMQDEKDVFVSWLMAEVQKPDPKAKVLALINEANLKKEEVEAFKKLDESELLPAVKRMGEYYDRMREWAKLPPQEIQPREEKLFQEVKQNGAKDLLTHWLSTMVSPGRRAEVRYLTRLALLDAGLVVLEDGEQVLKDPKHKDPFGDGPFEYRDTDNGFVLTSDLELAPGKKLSLTFGK